MYGAVYVVLSMVVPRLLLSVKVSYLFIFCFPCGVFILFYFLVFSTPVSFVI
jgi:hypothetical protein